MNLHAFHMIFWTPGPFHQGYRTYFGTQSWPVFAVTTAGSFEPALGTFIGLWSDELQRALQEGGQKSLGEIQALAESKYWADNAGIKASWPVEELLLLFFFLRLQHPNGQTRLRLRQPARLTTLSFSCMFDGLAFSQTFEVHNDRILAGELPTEASTESVGTVGCEAGFDGRSQQLMMSLPVQDCQLWGWVATAGWLAAVATLTRKS